MRNFLDDNFLLYNKTAERLYFDHAENQPIIDYHCHLSEQDIVENRHFNSITEAWLEGDHYKWRAMRANGIEERFCTGDASDPEKFGKWAQTVPFTLRNPLYHWTHLELRRYFGIEQILNEQTAEAIYEQTSESLQHTGTQDLLKKMKVEVVCTTNDPLDSLSFHDQRNSLQKDLILVPTFRSDKLMVTENVVAWNAYIEKLAEVANLGIESYDDLLAAIKKRHDFFHEMGCRLSDNGLSHIFAVPYKQSEVDHIFKLLREGKQINVEQAEKFKSAILFDTSCLHAEKGWTQQFHLGALRNNNDLMLEKLGPDTGFDSIGDFPQAEAMSVFFNRLEKEKRLAKTIVYNLNPSWNEVFATMMGNYNNEGVVGKMQFGSGWWFLDQKEGMERQLNTLSNMGLISRFVGMLTDSRSFLSFPRHEYFRRILCNLFGRDIENGELPNDISFVGKVIEDICYNNARNFFEFYEKPVESI
jgi:glucuronate isomerase